MRLEHINLVVSDIEQALTFYRAAFPHWQVRSEGQSNWYDYQRRWLHFGDEWQYLAFSDHGVGENRDLTGNQVGLAHFAYVVDNLDALRIRLENAGFQSRGAINVDKFRKNIYFIDADGFEIEFVEYLSDIPNQRNSD